MPPYAPLPELIADELRRIGWADEVFVCATDDPQIVVMEHEENLGALPPLFYAAPLYVLLQSLPYAMPWDILWRRIQRTCAPHPLATRFA